VLEDRNKAPVATQVMSGIADKIATGAYPVGSMLPSCRKLAKDLGVNKNTVAKAFGMLRDLGLARSVPGEGMLVIKRPAVNRKDAQHMLLTSLDEILYQSRVLGIDAEQVREVFQEALAKWYESARLSMVLVECNRYDAVSLANHIRKELPLSVNAVLLPDFVDKADDFVSSADLIVTTFYHLAEVKAAMQADDSAMVVALQDRPNIRSLLALSEIPKGRIGVVAGHERTVQTLERILREAGHEASERAVLDDPDNVRHLLYSCDTVVVSARCLSDLNKFSPTANVVTVVFEVDAQSMDYLRTTVSHMVDFGGKTSVSRA
jgi:GntR family transcriptional regulator